MLLPDKHRKVSPCVQTCHALVPKISVASLRHALRLFFGTKDVFIL